MRINIVDACNQMYGIKHKKVWPGTLITNLNQYANACYGSCGRFNNLQSVNQVLHTPCG